MNAISNPNIRGELGSESEIYLANIVKYIYKNWK